MAGQNAVLTSQNALKRLSQKSVCFNPFAWHSNSYFTFNHWHSMYLTLECHASRMSQGHSNCPFEQCRKNCYVFFQQQLGEVQISLQQKQNQMTQSLWSGNNDSCTSRVLRCGFSPPVHPPMQVCWYSISILQLYVLIAKKKRNETAISGIKLIT